MDALVLTLEPTGWHATPLGAWTVDLGPGPGWHVSPACASAAEVLAGLTCRVPPHVVITVEYAS